MKAYASSTTIILVGICSLLIMDVAAAPIETEEEPSENSLVSRQEFGDDMSAPWEAMNTAALRKLLLQIDNEERLGQRVARSWPQSGSRGWGGLRALDGRIARPWRTDKRQVRFRQCYFNPISCFRK